MISCFDLSILSNDPNLFFYYLKTESFVAVGLWFELAQSHWWFAKLYETVRSGRIQISQFVCNLMNRPSLSASFDYKTIGTKLPKSQFLSKSRKNWGWDHSEWKNRNMEACLRNILFSNQSRHGMTLIINFYSIQL